MDGDRLQRTQEAIVRLAGSGLSWVEFAAEVGGTIHRVIPFDRSCWHTVDPGTVLFTGSLNKDVSCSGSWLAQHEYVIDDVNKWWSLAHSGRRAGATSIATHGDLRRSARHRSQEAFGIGDELRGSFVADGTYWAAAAFLRDADRPTFTDPEVRLLAALSEPIAHGFRRTLVRSVPAIDAIPSSDGPGVIVLDEDGNGLCVSPAAERWIGEMVEEPPLVSPLQSKIVQIVAARARALAPDGDPLQLAARSRVRTRSGSWLLLYGTRLAGGSAGQVAVIIQPASPADVAPLVALAYGLTERERDVCGLCVRGRSTKQMAEALHVSPYTVQDHLKSIFEKTGVSTRGELVGQVFLEHYVPRWDDVANVPSGWLAWATPQLAAE